MRINSMDNRTALQQTYTISPEESERISILKLWLSIMIVFIHSSTLNEIFFADGTMVQKTMPWLDWTSYIISRVISQCAVPWFFFLSGMFLYRKPFRWLDNIKRKIRTLLIPYLILNTFWLVFYAIAQQIPAVSTYFANPDRLVANYNTLDFVNAYFGFKRMIRAGNYEPFLGILWFMRDLMALNLIAVAIKGIIDRYPKAVLAVVAVLLLFQIRLEDFIFCLSTRGIVFFSLGYYCVKYDIHLTILDKIKTIPFILVFATTISLACCLKGTLYEYWAKLLVFFTGGCTVFRFGTRFTYPHLRKKLIWLSRFSISIYLFHQMGTLLVIKLAGRLLPINPFTQTLAYFGIPVFMITFCILFSVACKAKLPKLYSLLTGSR